MMRTAQAVPDFVMKYYNFPVTIEHTRLETIFQTIIQFLETENTSIDHSIVYRLSKKNYRIYTAFFEIVQYCHFIIEIFHTSIENNFIIEVLFENGSRDLFYGLFRKIESLFESSSAVIKYTNQLRTFLQNSEMILTDELCNQFLSTDKIDIQREILPIIIECKPSIKAIYILDYALSQSLDHEILRLGTILFENIFHLLSNEQLIRYIFHLTIQYLSIPLSITTKNVLERIENLITRYNNKKEK